MDKVPQDFIDKFAPIAEGATFFGRRVEDMSHKEVMTVLGWALEHKRLSEERANGLMTRAQLLAEGRAARDVLVAETALSAACEAAKEYRLNDIYLIDPEEIVKSIDFQQATARP